MATAIDKYRRLAKQKEESESEELEEESDMAAGAESDGSESADEIQPTQLKTTSLQPQRQLVAARPSVHKSSVANQKCAMPVAIDYQNDDELELTAEQYVKAFYKDGAKDYGTLFPSEGRKVASLIRQINVLIDESDLRDLPKAGMDVDDTPVTVSRARCALLDSLFIIRMTLLWCTKQSKQFRECLPCLVSVLEEEPTTP